MTDVSRRCSPGDVCRQVPVRLVQEDLHALRHVLVQQLCIWEVQMLLIGRSRG